MPKQTPWIPATYFRAGTSKALFLQAKDIPVPGPARDQLLLRLMGSPDPMQIDGLGGTRVVTSKIAIVSPSDRDDADVDYTFVQVGINKATIDYSSNCGNISSGVGPYAIQEGLLNKFREGIRLDDGRTRTQEVKIFNTGTRKVLVSHVAVDEDGFPLEDQGTFEIAGCPGQAAPILMDFRNVVGATMGKGALPTGAVTNTTEVAGRKVEYTLCDVANTFVFASAEDLGILGSETSEDLNDNKELIARVRELRGKAAQSIGLCSDWRKVDQQTGMQPLVALMSSPTHPTASVQSRVFLENQCHTSMAGTGAVCIAACSKISGSVVNKFIHTANSSGQTFQIQHPLGLMPVIIETESSEGTTQQVPTFRTLSFARTARRIWDGKLYVPRDVRGTLTKIPQVEPPQAPTATVTSAVALKSAGASASHIHGLFCADLVQDMATKMKELVLDNIKVASTASREGESNSFVSTIKEVHEQTRKASLLTFDEFELLLRTYLRPSWLASLDI